MYWRCPTRILSGSGAFRRLPEVAQHLLRGKGRDARILYVYDEGLWKTGWPGHGIEALRASGVQTVIECTQMEVNPRCSTVERVAKQCKDEGVNLVIAVGGGSTIDGAKGACALATNGGEASSFIGKTYFPEAPLPLVAVPTTCGTGAEVTWGSVLSEEKSGTKITLKGEQLFPSVAIVDPDLLKSLPPHLIASTGMDAFTHAIEAYVSRPATMYSDCMSENAMALLFTYLPRAVRDIQQDDVAREAVARAATLGGIAIVNADVGAVHCLSESIGGLLDKPHGLTNATLLMPVLRHQEPSISPKLQRLAEVLRLPESPMSPAERILAEIEQLLEDVQIPSFHSLDIPEKFDNQLAGLAVKNGSNPSNMMRMDVDNYLEILQTARNI